ncbi:MAG: hypothetical protein WKG32_18415 [Gemmatimonadaceae bacterium]
MIVPRFQAPEAEGVPRRSASPDFAPPPGLVSALRGAVAEALADSGRSPALLPAVQEFVRYAKESGLRVESGIIVLKQLWESFPEAQRATPTAANALRDALITLSINEYFADVDAS